MIDLSCGDLEVAVSPHGARLSRLRCPGRDGEPGDVVLGHDGDDAYRDDPHYLGAVVGRLANRVGGARFVLDGREHVLDANEPPAVSLHGGRHGLDHADFEPDAVHDTADRRSVTLRHVSPDGEGGYPGRLAVAVTYTVGGGDVVVDLEASTDAPTPVDLTHHAYIDLDGTGDVTDQVLTVPAATWLPVDETLVPLGEVRPVCGTPFDLRHGVRIGDVLARTDDEQLRRAGGVDHTFVPALGTSPVRTVARVDAPRSGRSLTVLADRPGLQVYTGNQLDGSLRCRGRVIGRHGALCLEPQGFPNAINTPAFGSPVLRPGDHFRSRIVLRPGR